MHNHVLRMYLRKLRRKSLTALWPNACSITFSPHTSKSLLKALRRQSSINYLALYSRGLGTRGVYFHYVYMQRDNDVPLTYIYTIKSSVNSLRSLQKRGSKLWGRKMNSQSDYSIIVGVVSSCMTAVSQPMTRVPGGSQWQECPGVANDKSARG